MTKEKGATTPAQIEANNEIQARADELLRQIRGNKQSVLPFTPVAQPEQQQPPAKPEPQPPAPERKKKKNNEHTSEDSQWNLLGGRKKLFFLA